MTVVETKAAASQISVDFVHFLFTDYFGEIVNILIYLTKYSQLMPSMTLSAEAAEDTDGIPAEG